MLDTLPSTLASLDVMPPLQATICMWNIGCYIYQTAMQGATLDPPTAQEPDLALRLTRVPRPGGHLSHGQEIVHIRMLRQE